ncbi:MAG: hypothetical protein ACREPQ_03915 [Rhodanobacter sp.]
MKTSIFAFSEWPSHRGSIHIKQAACHQFMTLFSFDFLTPRQPGAAFLTPVSMTSRRDHGDGNGPAAAADWLIENQPCRRSEQPLADRAL